MHRAVIQWRTAASRFDNSCSSFQEKFSGWQWKPQGKGLKQNTRNNNKISDKPEQNFSLKRSISHPFRASFGNHRLREQGPLRRPCLWLHQDPRVWPRLQRVAQLALQGHQINCKQLPRGQNVLMIESDFGLFVLRSFTLNRAKCHRFSPPQWGANTFQARRKYVCYEQGEVKRLSPFRNWFPGNAQLCILANFLWGVLLNSCLGQLHCSPVKPEITILFLISCIWNWYAWLFSETHLHAKFCRYI